MGDALHDDYAEEYDNQASDYGWYPEFVLGLCYEHIQPGDCLLDIGIGTGLGSLPFARAGLQVTGLDESGKMLEVCRRKGFAQRLYQSDLACVPWDFQDRQFNHVICLGVLHFFDQLEFLIEEVVRVLQPGGIFAFTTNRPGSEHEQGQDPGNYIMRYVDGVEIFSHHQAYVQELLDSHDLDILKHMQVLLGFRQQYPTDLINLYVSRKRWEEDNS